MQSSIRHIILLVSTTLLLLSCMRKSKVPDMRETYNFKDAKPFGSKLAYEIFTGVYDDKYININNRSFSEFRRNTYSDEASLYMSISNKAFFSDEDAASLLGFVEDGHTAFISASWIDTSLLSQVDLAQTGNELFDLLSSYTKTGATLAPDRFSTKDSFGYYYRPIQNSFKNAGNSGAKVIGKNQSGEPNFVVLFLGKGRLYLHGEPRLLSNYFLLTQDNYLYWKQILQLMSASPGNLYWDDYLRTHQYKDDGGGGSALSILFKHPPLKAAFWIIVGLLLLYILFNGKRKQRIVPVIKPVENTSVEFSNAIAGLYLAEKNNKTIAEKMITYFNEFVRNKYFLHGYNNNMELAEILSRKTGIPLEKVQSLYLAMEQVQIAGEVSDFELLSLNEQIQYFYKNRN